MMNWNYDNFMLISSQSEQSLDVTQQKALWAVYSGLRVGGRKFFPKMEAINLSSLWTFLTFLRQFVRVHRYFYGGVKYQNERKHF